MRRLRAYISSTFNDLKSYRKRALEVLRALHSMDLLFSPIGMEDYGASSRRPADRCTTDLADADFVVLILGFQPGSVDYSVGHEARRITYVLKELKEAIAKNKPVLIFRLSDGASVSGSIQFQRDPKAEESMKELLEIIEQTKRLHATVADEDEFEEKLTDTIFEEFIKEDYVSVKRHYKDFFHRVGEWLQCMKGDVPRPRDRQNSFVERAAVVQGALCCGKSYLLKCLRWELMLKPGGVLARIIDSRVSTQATDAPARANWDLRAGADGIVVEVIQTARLTLHDLASQVAALPVSRRQVVLMLDDLDAFLFSKPDWESEQDAELRVRGAINLLDELAHRGVFILITTTLSVNLLHRNLARLSKKFSEDKPLTRFTEFMESPARKYAIRELNVADDARGTPLAHRLLFKGGIRGDVTDRSQLIHTLDAKLSILQFTAVMLHQLCPPNRGEEAAPRDPQELGSPWRILNPALCSPPLDSAQLRQVETSQFAEALKSIQSTVLSLIVMILEGLGARKPKPAEQIKFAKQLAERLAHYSTSPISLEALRALLGDFAPKGEDRKHFPDLLAVELIRSGLVYATDELNQWEAGVSDLRSGPKELQSKYFHASVLIKAVPGPSSESITHSSVLPKPCYPQVLSRTMRGSNSLHARIKVEEKIATHLLRGDYLEAWKLYCEELGGWRHLGVYKGDLMQGMRITSNMHEWCEMRMEYCFRERAKGSLGPDEFNSFLLFKIYVVLERARFIRMLDDYGFAEFLVERAESLRKFFRSGRKSVGPAKKSIKGIIAPLRRTIELAKDSLQTLQWYPAGRSNIWTKVSKKKLKHPTAKFAKRMAGDPRGRQFPTTGQIEAVNLFVEECIATLRLAVYHDIVHRDESEREETDSTKQCKPNLTWIVIQKIRKSRKGKEDFWLKGVFATKEVQLLKVLGDKDLTEADIVARLAADTAGDAKRYRDLRFVASETREDRYLGSHAGKSIAYLMQLDPGILYRCYPDDPALVENAYPKFPTPELRQINRAVRSTRCYGYTGLLQCFLVLRSRHHAREEHYTHALLDYLTFLYGWPSIYADDDANSYFSPRYDFKLRKVDEIIQWVRDCDGELPRVPPQGRPLPSYARMMERYGLPVISGEGGKTDKGRWNRQHREHLVGLALDAIRLVEGHSHLPKARDEKLKKEEEALRSFLSAFFDERFRDLSML